MQRTPASVRLTQLGARLRHVNPWVIDGLLASVFLVLSLIGHFAASGDAGAHYRDADAFSVVLTIGVAVPYYFRRRSPLPVLLISELCVVLLTVREYQTGATPSCCSSCVHDRGLVA